MNPPPAWLREAPPAEVAAFVAAAQRVKLPAAAQVFWPGDRCNQIVFVERGAVRVYQLSEEGRESTLYHIAPGESCLLTASCILGEVAFPAQAVVEQDTQGWAVPAAVFRRWMDESAWWRGYVFRLFGTRLAAVLGKLEAVSFRRVDARLAALLLRDVDADGEVRATHQVLADELGTAREVVSRTLAQWVAVGWVEAGRGRLRVRETEALRGLCD
ncbi:Crp/Fnr family transcriptional regulator [Actomonas aquatica]|uniref:Crp/Fnr family transcriptional regulator n=1 Tax=Actomonas aquatica TaxID=2866162 RepID=A0ABZ1C3S4_9BACT|nr:Crp/Fnr family transcriptional regulator [Opitutus sp. WL0086]WRQ86209.1 Crp/Fnr family transcriptional regulator [Opitutus sp. WL0086]